MAAHSSHRYGVSGTAGHISIMKKKVSAASQQRWSALPSGRFDCTERLGHGAYASVYKAYDNLRRRYVALKRVKMLAGSSAYQREVAFTSQCCDHPNVVTVLDRFEGQTHSFIALELASVEDMFARLTPTGKGLTQEEGALWMKQLTSAVSHCHAMGIVHGDIKPENILLDGHGNIKLCDFGLAQLIGTRLSAPIPGTACYMAPEQIQCDAMKQPYEYNTSADVWGIGIVLYAMLFADLPWERASPTDKDFARFCRRGGFKRSRQPFNMLSPRLFDILSRMLAVDPRSRCSMDEVVAFFSIHHPWFITEATPIANSTKEVLASSPFADEVQSAVSTLSISSLESGLSSLSAVSSATTSSEMFSHF
jgi:serine/threonine protein kinase